VTCTVGWDRDKMSQSCLICIVVHLEVRASCVLNIEIHVRRVFTAKQHFFHNMAPVLCLICTELHQRGETARILSEQKVL